VPAGGGVRLFSCGAKLRHCRITNNFCGKLGGGIIIQSSSKGVTIDSCIIQNNRTSFEKDGCNGGGLFCDTSKVTISNSTILGNTGRDGGGLFISYSSVSFHNCIIAKNKAEQFGGGLYIGKISPSDAITFNHCVVVSNEGNTNADSTGGAVYISTTGTNLVAKNSIFWMSKPQAFIGSVAVTYSFVQEPCAGMGNITDQPDPLFNSLTNNDFILKPGSPCIGKADDGKDMGLLF